MAEYLFKIQDILSASDDSLVDNFSASDIVQDTMTPLVYIDGSISGTSNIASILIGLGNLIGSSSGTSTAIADLDSPVDLVGFSSGTSNVTGDLIGLGSLIGSSSGISTALADIDGSIDLIGSSSGTSNATGTGKAYGYIDSSINGTSDTSATLRGRISISGSIEGTSTCTTLIGIGPIPRITFLNEFGLIGYNAQSIYLSATVEAQNGYSITSAHGLYINTSVGRFTGNYLQINPSKYMIEIEGKTTGTLIMSATQVY